MANIYKKQQVSDYAHNYYSAEGNFGQRMIHKAGEYEQEAEKKKKEAQNKYKNYLDLVTQDRFNDLIANPDLMGNPEAIKEEMGRIRDDMASGVNDEDVKTAYLGETDKIIGHYTQRAAVHQAALKEREKAAQEAQAKAYIAQMNRYKQAKLQNTFDFAAADLMQQFASNPQELSAQIDKLGAEIASTMKDDKEKLAFLTSVELKKNSLIKTAQNNQFNAYQNDRALTEEESAETAANDMALFSELMWNGNADETDVLNYDIAKEKFDSALSAKGTDGKPLLSNQEIKKLQKNADDAMLRGFKSYYNGLAPAKQAEVAERIKQSRGEIDLEGVGFKGVSSNVLTQMKDYVSDYAAVKKANDDRYNYNESVMQYGAQNELNEALEDLEPIQALDLLEENRGKVSSKYYKTKVKQLKENAGITAETEAETFTDLLMQINSIDKDRLSNEEIINAQNDVLNNIEEAYAEKKLKPSDRRTLLMTLNKEQGKRLPDLIDDKSSGLSWFGYNYEDAQEAFKKTLVNAGKVSQAMLEYHRTLSENPKATSLQKRDLVRTIANKYNVQALDDAVSGNTNEKVVNWQEYFKE